MHVTGSAAQGPTTGAISGRVVDEDTEEGIEGILVSMFDPHSASGGSAISEANGSFTSTPLPAGNYAIDTRNEVGYLDELYEDSPCHFPYLIHRGCPGSAGTLVEVRAGATTEDVVIRLSRGGTISGRITEDDELGTPISDIVVLIWDSSGKRVHAVEPDQEGAYVAIGLPTDSYYVSTAYGLRPFVDKIFDNRICPTGGINFDCGVASATPIAVVAGEVVEDVDFRLSQGGRISGSVSTVEGIPFSTGVHVFSETGNYFGTKFSDDAGMFDTYAAGYGMGLPDGRYHLIASGDGTFVDQLHDGPSCPTPRFLDPTIQERRPIPSCRLPERASIAIANASHEEKVTITLRVGGSIIGTVLKEGEPEFGPVFAYNFEGKKVARGQAGPGDYEITGLPEGQYYVGTGSLRALRGEIFDDVLCVGLDHESTKGFSPCDVTAGDPVAVLGTSITTGVDFDLQIGSSIRGRIADADNRAIFAAVIDAFDSNGAWLARTISSVTGTYFLSGLPPSGDAYLVATASGHGSEAFGVGPCLNCDPRSGEALSLSPGATTSEIDFSLPEDTETVFASGFGDRQLPPIGGFSSLH